LNGLFLGAICFSLNLTLPVLKIMVWVTEYEVYFPQIPNEEKLNALKKITNFLDLLYGYKEALWVRIVKIVRVLSFKYLQFCPSVAYLFEGMNPKNTAPGDIIKVMKETPDKFILIKVGQFQ